MQTLSWVQRGLWWPLHVGHCLAFRECRTDFQFIVWPRRSPALERVKNRCSHSQPTTFLKANKQSTYNVSYQEILTTVLHKIWYLNWVCPPWDWYCRFCYPGQVSEVAPILMLHEISLFVWVTPALGVLTPVYTPASLEDHLKLWISGILCRLSEFIVDSSEAPNLKHCIWLISYSLI